jgi:hypothetical protein
VVATNGNNTMTILRNTAPHSNVGSAWAPRAPQLAEWARQRLVNRRDAWGAYRPLGRREHGNSWTAPAKRDRDRVLLTEALLRRHFAAARPEHVLGLHSTSPGNTSLWGALDIDWHGPTSTAPAVNLAAALAWYDRLRGLGLLPLLTDSNGQGGYHLRVLFRQPVPTAKVFAFLRWLVRDHAALGLPQAPETFPKQAALPVRPDGTAGYGNWLRLPGRHHTREHWSRVWDGAAWLEGEAAALYLLALHGDDPALIAAVVVAPRPRLAPPPPAALPRPLPDDQLARRIWAYLARLPAGLGEGQRRDDHGYNFAAFLVRDLALTDALALPWMREWDARNGVAKGEAQLLKLLKNAHDYGRNPVGCGLHRPVLPRRGRAGRHPLRHIRITVEA